MRAAALASAPLSSRNECSVSSWIPEPILSRTSNPHVGILWRLSLAGDLLAQTSPSPSPAEAHTPASRPRIAALVQQPVLHLCGQNSLCPLQWPWLHPGACLRQSCKAHHHPLPATPGWPQPTAPGTLQSSLCIPKAHWTVSCSWRGDTSHTQTPDQGMMPPTWGGSDGPAPTLTEQSCPKCYSGR